MNGHQATPAKATGGISKGFASASNTNLTQVIPAPDPGFALMITHLVVFNSDPSNASGVDIYSGSTKIWGTIPAPAQNGGAIVGPLDPPLPLAAAQALGFKAVTSATSISVSAIGYIALANET